MSGPERGTPPAARSPASLQIEAVNLSYGDNHVLKDVSLDVRPGELFAFLGPSGCGKTTLLRLVAGFNVADSGRVLVAGEDVSRLPPWRRDVGLVFQSYALWPHMSVAENVAFGLEERRLPRSEVRQRTTAALDLVGLADYAGRRPSQLSGGQQQRVALARTIAVEPKLLLLDEPLSNLDAQLRVQVRRELRDMQRRLGMTTVFVTHDQEEANTICDRIAVMRDGVIQQVGTPVELYEQPANLFVGGFLGTLNILCGGEWLPDGTLFQLVDGQRIPVASGPSFRREGKLVFRPQDAKLSPSEDLEAYPVRLHGMISRSEFLGSTVRYVVAVGSDEILVDQPFHGGTSLLASGTPVELGLRPGALRCLLP
jgi:iron(III) transport system ATP-binding protein